MRAEEVFSAPTAIGTIHIHDTPVLILFDTGVTHCFISLDCVQRLGLEPTVCDCFVVGLPDGSRVKGSLELLECPIRIATRVWPADLIVMDLPREDLILGMDWMRRHGVVIDLQTHTVTLTAADGSQHEVWTADPKKEGLLISAVRTSYYSNFLLFNHYLIIS